jgi:hypothetical protein
VVSIRKVLTAGAAGAALAFALPGAAQAGNTVPHSNGNVLVHRGACKAHAVLWTRGGAVRDAGLWTNCHLPLRYRMKVWTDGLLVWQMRDFTSFGATWETGWLPYCANARLTIEFLEKPRVASTARTVLR